MGWGKTAVAKLQYLLVHSFYAKAIAVKRVTSNKGHKTPGVDGVTWEKTVQKLESVYCLKTEKVSAEPLKESVHRKTWQKGKETVKHPNYE